MIDRYNNFFENMFTGELEFLYLDGAMGTMLQDAGLETGKFPEELNITNPNSISDIYLSYLNAGSKIITTNTFGANRLKLKDSSYSVNDLISAGVKIAKESITRYTNNYMLENAFIDGIPAHNFQKDEDEPNLYDLRRCIALDIGPIGTLLSPLGTLPFEEAYDIFKEQVLAGVEAGVDIILIETMTDIYEVKAAILAAKENSDLPVFSTMSFQENGRTFAGTDVATFVSVAEGLGVDALGVNCSLGPKQLQAIVDDLVKYSSTPVMVQANAGLPKYDNNKTYYDIDSNEYSKQIKIMAKKGVTIFGGCCGTTPEYIKDIISTLTDSEVKPIRISSKNFTTCTSSSQTVFIGDDVKIIGERINPTGKKLLKEALRNNNMDYIIKEAIKQEETGSAILDINVGLPDINEKEMMERVITEVQSIISLPLQIDSADIDVIASTARIYNGKPIINSVNGKKENMETILPIVKRYGTLVIALTLDEDGIPKTAAKRVEIASNIIETAKTYGIAEENILVDPLVLTASAEQEAVMETLRSIPLIKEKYNVKIVLGASNVSFGLPNRNLLNSTYLAIALAYGLDAPITDSTNEALMGVIRSFRVLNNQDKDSKDYVDAYSNVTITTSSSNNAYDNGLDSNTGLYSSTEQILNKSGDLGSMLQDSIIKGLKEESKRISAQLFDQYDSLEIVNKFLIPALDIVGEKYENQEIFLPQLIRSAEASKEVFELIKETTMKLDNKEDEITEGDKIVMATVAGDIHDIGKNIVKLILENYGYNIIDLGKDVPIEKVVESAKREHVKLVGLSALMTTTVKNMEFTIKALKDSNPDIKVMVGGAVLTQDYADKIGADYYSKDARGAVEIAREIFS